MLKISILFWLATAVYISAQKRDSILLQETVISASRWEQAAKAVPTRIVSISNREIAAQNQQSTADLLQNTGQVFVQKSQSAGGSAIIRGFEASRISLVVDGIRMNNAIYRLGHLQDVITIDQSMLEKTEILFGTASTMYGSDALGGVIHFYTKNPMLNNSSGIAYTRYSSSNHEKTGHLDVNFGGGKFAALTSLSISDFGDQQVGNSFEKRFGDWGKCLYYLSRENGKDIVNDNPNPSVMVSSAYKQIDFLQKLLFKPTETVSHGINIQYSNNIGNVPRFDRMLELSQGKPKYAENSYGPQTRFLAAYTFNLNAPKLLFDDVKIILSSQKIDQDRISRKLNNNSRITNLEDAFIAALNLDISKKISDKTKLIYGAEWIYNNIQSTASNTNISTGQTIWNKDDKTIVTRFADGGSQWSSLAIYTQAHHEISNQLTATAGIRISSVRLTSHYNDATAYPETTIRSAAATPSGTLGLVANLLSNTKISILGSTGFRAPNVEDMTAFAPASGASARVPNLNLKPESAYSAELNATQIWGSFLKLDAGVYCTILQNAMVVRDTKYNGKDSVLVNGITYKAQSIQNANQGNIYGWHLTLKANATKEISLNGTLTGTYGTYKIESNGIGSKKDTIVPMDHIPPYFGKVGIHYHHKKLEMEAFVRFSCAKKTADYSPSGEDNLPQASFTLDTNGEYSVAAGSPAWYTVNFRTSYQLTKNFSANAGIENLLDLHYRQFASGISAPGRNIYFTLRVGI